MQRIISHTPWQLALRHWLLTTTLGFVLSYLVIDYTLSHSPSSYQHYRHSGEAFSWAGGVALVGAVLGLVGIWWVRLLFIWAAPTRRPWLIVGLGLLLTYLVGYGIFFRGGPSGGGLLPLVLPVWCIASLLALGIISRKPNA